MRDIPDTVDASYRLIGRFRRKVGAQLLVTQALLCARIELSVGPRILAIRGVCGMIMA